MQYRIFAGTYLIYIFVVYLKNMKQFLKGTFLGMCLLIFSCAIFISAKNILPPGYNNIAYKVLKIKPSSTDSSIKRHDDVHLVVYDSTSKQGKLLLFMQGTTGKPDRGPKDFYNTVVEAGYRLIVLSYIDDTGVSQVCIGHNLKVDCDCPAKFRTKRIYGENTTPLITDQKQDAIVNRLTKLLQYLVIHDPAGHWDMYLEKGSPKWGIIALAGQSQGGGMAAFMAKKLRVAKVISFSGGWDWSVEDKKIANWYSTPSVTPLNLWYGTYNKAEETAQAIGQTYKAMGIPEDHIHELSLPVRQGGTPHADGLWNPAYKPLWVEFLGKGN